MTAQPLDRSLSAAARAGASPMIRRLGVWGATAAVMVALPLIFTSGFAHSMLSQMGIAVIFALSYNMLLGQGGMLSFGHAVFYGLGGFLAMHVLGEISPDGFAMPIEFLPLVGGLAGMGFAAIFGYVSTKRSGTTFAMISLGIGELVAASALMFPSFFGGESGIWGDRVTETSFLGLIYGRQIEVYYLIAAWAFIAMIAMFLLTKTPLGRMANAVRDNPERAQFVGYDPRIVRFVQFTLAGFFAGVAGGLFAINYEIVSAENVGATPSGAVLLMTYIGGVGHFFGPILGAILVTFLQLTLSNFTEAWLLYFGLIFMTMVLFAPGGLAGLLMMHEPLWRARRLHRIAGPYAQALATGLVLLVGAIILIEINYFLSTSYEPEMHLFGFVIDPSSPWPWALAAALIVIGFVTFRGACRAVMRRWDEVLGDIKAGGRS